LIPSHDVAQPLLAKANSSHRADAESYVAVSNSGDVGYCLTASAQNSLDAETETLIAVAHALRGEGFDASRDGEAKTPSADAEGRIRLRPPGLGITEGVAPTLDAGIPHAVAFYSKGTQVQTDETGTAPTLRAMGHASSHQNGGGQLAVAFQDRTRGDDGRGYDRPPPISEEVVGTLETVKHWNVATPWAVRRLTPVECERLMDFPDGFTRIPYRGKPADRCPDGPRYKALGNSWAVNVAEWVGERIAIVDAWPENETRAARPTNGDPHGESQ